MPDVELTKSGKTVEYEGGNLEEFIDYILYSRWGNQVHPMNYLFTTRLGTPYTPTGFKSLWRRQMNKYVDAGGEKFNEHDV